MLKWIEIDLSAIEANLEAVRRLLKPGVGLLGVVKADAYGHGAVRVAKLLVEKGVKQLGVFTVEEGLELRSSGVKAPLWVLSPPLPEYAGIVIQERLTPTVDNLPLLKALSEAARARGARVGLHADLDFGLGRWGLAPKRLDEFARFVSRQRGLRLDGLSTHLDYVPGKNAVEAEEKLRVFSRICRRAKRRGPLLCHAANSSILLDFPHWQLDLARVGNLLYGINPTAQPAALSNPWQFVARVISVRTVQKGRPIGYGAAYLAPRRMTVAALPVGYSDGLTMEPAERLIKLSSSASYWGVLRGHPVPFVGRVGISHVLVDASAVPGVRPGDAVALPIRRTAASARLPRVYKVTAGEARPGRQAPREAAPPPLP